MTGVTQKIADRANARQVGGDHYKTGGIELWDLFGPESIIFYASRYLQRWRKKNGVVDLEKALHCVQKLREIAPHHATRNVLVVDDNLFASWLHNAVDGAEEKSIVRRIVIQWKDDAELEFAQRQIEYLIKKAPVKESNEDLADEGDVYMRIARAKNMTRKEVKDKILLMFFPRENKQHLTDEQLKAEIAEYDKKIEEYPHWGAALTAYDEHRKELQAELARRERRVPRYADGGYVSPQQSRLDEVAGRVPLPGERTTSKHEAFAAPYGDILSCGDGLADVHVRKRATPESVLMRHAVLSADQQRIPDGACCAPWVVDRAWIEKCTIGTDLIDRFWTHRGPMMFVLESNSTSHNIPRELRACYTLGLCGWTLDVRKCPPEAREFFPNLLESCNSVEWGELREWQRTLYQWVEDLNKYVLTDHAWHYEEELT
jgi:hypothetical protein